MNPEIALLTGTFGTEVQNGVGRFLHGLHGWSLDENYPLEIFSAGEHISHYADVHDIHSLSIPIPGGYTAVKAYYPLEGQRKQLRRAIKRINPDIVHVSTPEVIGLTGVRIARKQKRLLAGIYHTDFPAFVGKLVREELKRLVADNGSRDISLKFLKPWLSRASDLYRMCAPAWERWIQRFLWRRFSKRNAQKFEEFLNVGIERCAVMVERSLLAGLHQFYSPFDLVIARSEASRRAISHELSLPDERLRTLECGVDTRLFHPKKRNIDDDLRLQFGIPEESRVVLYVGRVTDEKNVSFLAKAWRQYSAIAKIPTVFVVVGSGQLDWFREQAGPKVLTVGPQSGPKLSAIYRLADVFWTASPHETLGQVVLESLASGVPVIVSNRGAACENVRDGQTGRLLTLDDPAEWAVELSELLSHPERRRSLGVSARQYAERHSIEDSYRHFWELHAELHERHQTQSTKVSIACLDESLHSPPIDNHLRFVGMPSVHFSDFHAGKRGKKIPKEAALRAACERVRDRDAKCFLHGDFLDTRPTLQKLYLELEMVNRTFAEFGIEPALYLEGNHDYEFGRAGEIEDLMQSPVAESLVHYDADTGLVLTHGHISELPEVWEILKASHNNDEIIDKLKVDQLKQSLRISALRYDLVTSLTNMIENAGLEGLEEAWRYSMLMRRKLASLLSAHPYVNQHHNFGVHALMHMVGSNDREHILGHLCQSLGGWGLVYGHTHEPHLTFQEVVDLHTGKKHTVLLGNSGSFCRKSVPPTWIEAEFPTMELWCYNPAIGAAELMDRATLPREEQRRYSELHPTPPLAAVG